MDSLVDLLDRRAQQHPEKLLFRFLGRTGEPLDSYTYGAFVERTAALASALVRRHGFSAGDRLLLAYPPGLEMVCAFFACARAGIVPVPAYPPAAGAFSAAARRLAHIARDCDAAGILTVNDVADLQNKHLSERGAASAVQAALSLPWIPTDLDSSAADGPIVATPSELLFLQYTSGSTSEPKGVMVTHDNVIHNGRALGATTDSVGVSWLPQFHDMGLIGYYLYPVVVGGTTYGFAPIDFVQRPALWLETMSRYRATNSSAPNFAFEYCLRQDLVPDEHLAQIDLSSLELLMVAAEPVRATTYARFTERFQPYGLRPRSFVAAYGLAENTLAVSSGGRHALSITKKALALGVVRPASAASDIASARQVMSCGPPLDQTHVAIVDPEHHTLLPEHAVGEIWVDGPSRCIGYWNRRRETARTFGARLVGSANGHAQYLRTGDLGFMSGGELYVCGRLKDVIIVRGQNVYPQDVEQVIEEAGASVRPAGVVAFESEAEDGSVLAVVAEARRRNALPDPDELAVAVRNALHMNPGIVVIVPPKSIPKTSSGKPMRHAVKTLWENGELEVLAQWPHDGIPIRARDAISSPFEAIKARYNLRGDERQTLIEIGVDSLDLVLLAHEIEAALEDKGAQALARRVDVRLVQQLAVADLLRFATLLESAPQEALLAARQTLDAVIEQQRHSELEAMLQDSRLQFVPTVAQRSSPGRAILLTGGSGFLGPFLLASLLDQTEAPIDVLIRAPDEPNGRARLRSALAEVGLLSPQRLAEFDERVHAVCGDLALPQLGLADTVWERLAADVGEIYHSGAAVNYVYTYDALRSANVLGTSEMVRLAFAHHQKPLNYVSTTFIFGWAVKSVLYETDCNDSMELLDFGYSQSKWAAEQVVMDAARHGLPTRIFRPALISPSVDGEGTNLDISIRLLAFMIAHGIGVSALNQVSLVPADVVAHNIVAISNAPASIGGTFHMTRDEYSNILDVLDIITQLTGREFELFALRDFVPEVIRRCTKDDLLFPLLDFLIASVDNIGSMEFKRYDNSRYQAARAAVLCGLPDPSLEETVVGILRFMERKNIVRVRASPLLPRGVDIFMARR